MATRTGSNSSAGPEDPVPPSTPWILLATAALWGGAGLLIRAAPVAGPQLAFWRILSAAGIYQAILLARGRRPSWQLTKEAAMGGVGYGLGLVLQFIAMKSTNLVSVAVILALQPLLLALVAHRYFGARHGRVAIGATVVAVLGAVIVVLGSTSAGSWSLGGDVAALASVVVSCLYPIGVKRARSAMGPLQFQAYGLLTAAAVTLPVAAFTRGGLDPPGAAVWLFIAAIIAVGGSGHLLFTWAQKHVSITLSSTITLAEIAVIAVGAALVFHQRVGLGQIAGMSVLGAAVGWWVAKG